MADAPSHTATDNQLTAGEITSFIKRHTVILNPDTGQGRVCMWCGDQPSTMTTSQHVGQVMAPHIWKLRHTAWEEGKKASDSADLFHAGATNPYEPKA
jgi:hypothetical protein